MAEEAKQSGIKSGMVEELSGVDYTYVSGVQMSSNNWDVRFAFFDRQPTGVIIPKIGIVMSHRHAKAMLEVLKAQVEALEERFGVLEIEGKPKIAEIEHSE